MSPGRLALAARSDLRQGRLFIALMLLVGARVLPWLLDQVVRTGSRELFTLAVDRRGTRGSPLPRPSCSGCRLRSARFSPASSSTRATTATGPPSRQSRSKTPSPCCFSCRSGCCSTRRFWSGTRFRCWPCSPSFCSASRSRRSSIVRIAGYPAATALTVAASLAQIGEFSFMLAALGTSHGLLERGGSQPDPRRRADLDHLEPGRLSRRGGIASAARPGAVSRLEPAAPHAAASRFRSAQCQRRRRASRRAASAPRCRRSPRRAWSRRHRPRWRPALRPLPRRPREVPTSRARCAPAAPVAAAGAR